MTNAQKHETVNADLRTRYGATMTHGDLSEYKRLTGVDALWIRRTPENKVGRGTYRIPGASDAQVQAAILSASKQKAPKVGCQTVASSRLEPQVVETKLVAANVVASPAETPVVNAIANTSHSFELTTDQDNTVARLASIAQEASALATIPAKDPCFVPFGDYDMVRTVIQSRKFFPVFVTGLSGNGKTMSVEQACADEQREYIRANITLETDEDDLLGGFRLKNGSTVFELGPAIIAMLRGAVLLLDEIDLASPKIMCLQPILEGKPITLKKLGITVSPAPGFTVFATANTKGRGSEDGKFIGTGLLNEAFLERFPVTVEQEYPGIAVEKKILGKAFEAMGFKMTDHAATFFDTLSRWAEAIRVTYAEGAIEDLISTRRLVHIVRAYAIFGGNDTKALAFCVNRFDAKVKDAFCDLYNKLAPDLTAPSNVGSLDGDVVTTASF